MDGLGIYSERKKESIILLKVEFQIVLVFPISKLVKM